MAWLVAMFGRELRKARFWATIYFLLIPFFAFVYSSWLRPHSFYHVTADKEPTVRNMGAQMLGRLRAAMIHNLEVYAPKGEVTDRWE